tara:strand:- start:3908 stop:4282 length:375 start_codon:yes stop_codon:yes gene_type:complete
MNKLIVTNSAWSKLSSIIKNSNNNSFMLSAKSGGCGGYNYSFKMITDYNFKNILKKKAILKNNNNINVILDPTSEFLLIGTKIDYINKDLDMGIFEGKFVFIPDERLSNCCGCGNSFNYKDIIE